MASWYAPGVVASMTVGTLIRIAGRAYPHPALSPLTRTVAIGKPVTSTPRITMPATKRLALLLPITVAVLACDDTTSSSAGTGETSSWSIVADPELILGQLEGPAETLLSQIRGALVLPDGRIAVADGGSNTIRLFNADGSFDSMFGGEGQGPGEFERISTLHFHQPDELWVYDGRALRLSIFRTNGELVETTSFRSEAGFPEVYIGRFSDGHHAVAWITQTARAQDVVTPDPIEVGRFDPDGHLAEVVFEDSGMRRLGSPIPFSPHFAGALIGDTVFTLNGLDGRVLGRGASGDTVAEWTFPVAPVSATEARELLVPQLDSSALRRFEALPGLPEFDAVPWVSDLITDAGGRLWLKQYDPALDGHWTGRRRTGGVWYALSTAGETVASVEVPDSLRLLFVGEDQVVGLTRDDLGVERIRVHRLVRP